MNTPGTWAAASELFLVEHYAERRLAANSTTVALRGGGSDRTALASGEFSMLDSAGRLPNNKIGRISGVMVDFDQAVAGADAAARLAIFNAIHDMRAKCRFRLRVGGVQLCEHPIAMLTAPGAFSSVGTSTAGDVFRAGNNGWPVSFGEHPIVERQQIEWDIDSLAALTTAPASGAIGVCVTIQIKTQSIIPGATAR